MGVPAKSIGSKKVFLVVASGSPHLFEADQGPVEFLDLSKIRTSKPVGASIRQRIEKTSADIVVILDNPDILTAGWLDAAVAQLDEGAAAVVAGVIAGQENSVAPIGAASLFRTETLREIGGFQDVFDSSAAVLDALWRLQTRGHKVVCLPGYSSCEMHSPYRASDLLAVAAANLGRENVDRVFANFVMELITEPFEKEQIDTSSLDLERSPGGDEVGFLNLSPTALVGVGEVNRLLKLMHGIDKSRHAADATRRLADRFLADQIVVYLNYTAKVISSRENPLRNSMFAPAPETLVKIALVTQDSLDEVAGKCWLGLAKTFEVSWGCVDDGLVRQVKAGSWIEVDTQLNDLSDWADVVVLKNVVVRSVPRVTSSSLPVLVDATDWHFEQLLETEFSGTMGRDDNRGVLAMLVGETLERADYVLTRDQNHRDRILGWMAGLGRINPVIYDEDHSLQNLVSAPVSDLGVTVSDWCRRPLLAADRVTSHPRLAVSKRKNPFAYIAKIWSR